MKPIYDTLFHPQINDDDKIREWKLVAFYRLLSIYLLVVSLPMSAILYVLKWQTMLVVNVVHVTLLVLLFRLLLRGHLRLVVNLFILLNSAGTLLFVNRVGLNDGAAFLTLNLIIAGIFLGPRSSFIWAAVFTIALLSTAAGSIQLTLLPEIILRPPRAPKLISSGRHFSTIIFMIWVFSFFGLLFQRYFRDLLPLLNESYFELTEKVSALDGIGEELAEKEKELALITESSFDVIFTVSKSGKILYISPSIEQLTGHTPEELIGTRFPQYVPKRELSAYWGKLKQVFLKRTVSGFETLVLDRTGREIPVEISGKLVKTTRGFVGQGAMRNISDRKRAEAELEEYRGHLESIVEKRTAELAEANEKLLSDIAERERIESALKASEERFRTLFEYAPDACYINDFKGNFVDGNRMAEKITGYKREELIGRNFLRLNLLPLSLIPKAAKGLAQNALGKATGPDEYVLNRKDGSQITLEISAQPIQLGDRKMALGTARDITDRKRMAEERKALEEQLMHAQKMESIGILAGGVAHDFNNMLGGIVGFAEMIRTHLRPEDSKLREYTKIILETSQRASELTAKLLAFARKGKLRVVAVDVHQTIQEVIGLLLHTIDKRISITQELRADNPIIQGDPAQIQNLVMNLAVNACDAMPNGGGLTFSTDLVVLDRDSARVKSGEISSGAFLMFAVRDTGTGMSHDIINKIFEPFFTTKDVGKGTGLGLASAYGTVRGHHGCLEVASEPQKGSEFRVYLPSSSGEKNPAEASARISKGTGRILIVDDESVIRQSLASMLESLGYTSVSVANGTEAVEYYRSHCDEIDVVVLDVRMPKMGGYDCFAELRKINPSVKVMVSSGYAVDGEAERIMRAGANRFVQKPFGIASLSRAINDVLSE